MNSFESKSTSELLVEKILQGYRPNNILINKKAWKYVQDEFYKQTGLKFDRQQLKNHLDVLRKRYNYVKVLLEQNEFSWDATRSMVIAEDDVWQNYIQAHPDAETIRKKGCPIYLQLCMILSDSGTDEKCALSNSVTTGDQMGHDHSRANWTVPLEKIFADLMLEQTLYFGVNSLLEHNGFSWDRTQCMIIAEDGVWAKHIRVHPEVEVRAKGCPLYYLLGRILLDPGNNRNYGFSDLQSASSQQTQQNCASYKKAWKRIREQFNQQTSLNFDEQQLRNHQSVLRRGYNNIKSLLDQNGFSWNESRHMVVDDDQMWENYIKLCILFSEPGAEGRYVQSSHDIELNQEIVTLDTPEVDCICTEPIAGEVSWCPTDVVSTSDEKGMRQTVMPLSLGRHSRTNTENSDTTGNAILKMVSSTKKRAVVPLRGNQFSIRFKELNRIFMSALDLFQDPDRRETFISIKSDIRLVWLKRKCDCLVVFVRI